MRPPKPLPSPADQERRSGVGWDESPLLLPLNAPRIHSGHASAQRQGFSLSTVSIDHILHGLRRACSLGQQGGKDRVNDTLHSAPGVDIK